MIVWWGSDLGKASALSWSESESKTADLRKLRHLEALSTMGSSNAEGKSQELLQLDSSTSVPDSSPFSDSKEAEEVEEEEEEESL